MKTAIDIIDTEVNASLDSICLSGKRFWEVDAMQQVMLVALPAAAKKLKYNSFLSSANINLSSAFTHATPQVKFKLFGSDACCEMADILFVVDVTLRTKNYRRAAFVQVKMSNDGLISIGGGKELEQYELISSWPDFYFNNRDYCSRVRNIRNDKKYTHSGEYASVFKNKIKNKNSKYWYQWLTNAGVVSFHSSISLGSLIVGMICDADAHGRSAVIGGPDEWSELVDEVLSVAMVKKSKSYTRYSSVCFVDGFDGDGLPPADERGDRERENGPISVVHFKIAMDALELSI